MSWDDFENNADLATAGDGGQGDWNHFMQNVTSREYHFQTNVMYRPRPTTQTRLLNFNPQKTVTRMILWN